MICFYSGILSRIRNIADAAPIAKIPKMIRDSLILIEAISPPMNAEKASAATWRDWLFPITLPWALSETAYESMVDEAGSKRARVLLVKNSVTHRLAWGLGKMMRIMKRPVNRPDANVKFLAENRLNKDPVSPKLTKIMGTDTHAMYSESFETSTWNSFTMYIG